MTKEEEALNKIIEYCKNGSKTPVSDFCRIPCSICPFDECANDCENEITVDLIERLLKAEERQETNLEHYYDSKLAFDKGVTDDIYTLCFKVGTDEVYKQSGIYDFKRWLLSPYEEPPKPKFKLTQFELDLLDANRVYTYGIEDYFHLESMAKRGYFKDVPTDVPIQDILDNCEVVD